MSARTPYDGFEGRENVSERMPCRLCLSAGTALRRAAVPLLLMVLWFAASHAEVFPSLLLPAPERVFTHAFELMRSGELPAHAAVSMTRVVTGFLLAASAALLLAFLFYRRPRWEDGASVLLESLRVVPPLSLVPLLILWLGIDEAPKLAIVILSSFFPVYLNALSALRTVEGTYREYAQAFGLTALESLRHIHAPGAMPGLLTGLRLGFGYAWRALIGAELIAAGSGLGYLIEDASAMARTDVVFVGILTIALLGILCDALFQWGTARALGFLRRPRSLSAASVVKTREAARELPAVRLEGLTKRFGDTTPVRNLTDRLPAGRVTALLGRSGCGKTTLLRMIAGLLPPSAGRVVFETQDGKRIEPRIGVVFQAPFLLDWKSVRENVEMGILHVEPAERAARALEALDVVGLRDSADARPSELSGGMAQRVGFARALARRPEVLLMDEPFGALDALTRTALQRGCRRILAERPMTVLLITHDVREAVRLADDIRLLEAGELRTMGAVNDPERREASAEAAELEASILDSLLDAGRLRKP